MNNIIIHDVGLRDGLQMESQTVPFETKVKWTQLLIDSGIDIIQLGSFVNPQKVPQMADTDKLCLYFTKENKPEKEITFSALVLNEKGYERAINSGVQLICMGVSASNTHSLKNTGMTTEQAQERIMNIAKDAIFNGYKIQASVQSAFGCGFEGDIPEERVINIIRKYIDFGIENISLADTAGYANPEKVKRMINKILEINETTSIACHFHNTFGMGLTNCYSAIQAGAKYIETAFGGLGGCPFTKLPAGNVCTEDFVNMLQEMGYRKDININTLIELAKEVSTFFNRELPGFVHKSGLIKH